MIAAFFLAVDTGMAQSDKKEQRKVEKAEKKRLKKEARQKQQDLVMALVNEQAFVLEAHTIRGRYMNSFPVSPGTNFVMIEGDQITIQTANNFGFGYNGLGGVTINGTISEYKVISKDKNGSTVLIQFSSPVLGHSTLNLHVQGSGQAQALVTNNWGRRITFQGQMVAPEDSRVFEGNSLI